MAVTTGLGERCSLRKSSRPPRHTTQTLNINQKVVFSSGTEKGACSVGFGMQGRVRRIPNAARFARVLSRADAPPPQKQRHILVCTSDYLFMLRNSTPRPTVWRFFLSTCEHSRLIFRLASLVFVGVMVSFPRQQLAPSALRRHR